MSVWEVKMSVNSNISLKGRIIYKSDETKTGLASITAANEETTIHSMHQECQEDTNDCSLESPTF